MPEMDGLELLSETRKISPNAGEDNLDLSTSPMPRWNLVNAKQ
jgi:hypothetical protein